MPTSNISALSKILLIFAAIMLAIAIFVPIWYIDFDAPQYPEGLKLFIYSYKIGGEVDIINGLNHYIGMQTLHAENFIEFTVLPYLIGFFALFSLAAAIIGKKKWLYALLIAFFLFGILSMIDFWRWEYDYGHNLDPTAAIQVPGMSYQPPLIGYKQLLNFGVYSMPALGGWLFIVSGLLMLVAVLFEAGYLKRLLNRRAPTGVAFIALATCFALVACTPEKPQPIKLNYDNCVHCKMTIADGKFGCEMFNPKGRCYKFDDLKCLFAYRQANTQTAFESFFVHDYTQNKVLINAETAFYVEAAALKSPMAGNVAAFGDKESAKQYAQQQNTTVKNWNEVNF